MIFNFGSNFSDVAVHVFFPENIESKVNKKISILRCKALYEYFLFHKSMRETWLCMQVWLDWSVDGE